MVAQPPIRPWPKLGTETVPLETLKFTAAPTDRARFALFMAKVRGWLPGVSVTDVSPEPSVKPPIDCEVAVELFPANVNEPPLDAIPSAEERRLELLTPPLSRISDEPPYKVKPERPFKLPLPFKVRTVAALFKLSAELRVSEAEKTKLPLARARLLLVPDDDRTPETVKAFGLLLVQVCTAPMARLALMTCPAAPPEVFWIVTPSEPRVRVFAPPMVTVPVASLVKVTPLTLKSCPSVFIRL